MTNYLLIILLALLSNMAHSDAYFDSQLERAEQGDANAQWALGFMYSEGLGVPENDQTAVMWYTKAAEQGYADAQTSLGFMYASGEGVPENYVRAYVWWLVGSSSNSSLENIKEIMTKESIVKAQELAAKCYESDYKDCKG